MYLIRLQCVQNSAARLVTRTKTQDHITPELRDLQWLSVSSRIDFNMVKLCLYMYKALKKKLFPFTSRMSSVSMNLKDPYDPAMLGPLYTGSVGREEVSDFAFAIKGPRL